MNKLVFFTLFFSHLTEKSNPKIMKDTHVNIRGGGGNYVKILKINNKIPKYT